MRRSRVLLAAGAALVGAVTVAGVVLAQRPPETPRAVAPTRTTSPPGQPASTSPAPVPATTLLPQPPPGSLVATAVVPSLAAHGRPAGAVTSTWTNPQREGVPLTFRVVASRGRWLHVQLPQRPNGSTGWIQASDVNLTRVTYRLLVSTEKNTLSLFDGDVLVKSYTVATGTGGTPTPHGSFYLTELLSPVNAGYGPFAFGLSAFSEALSSFGGGPGQIGLHGTDDSASIGHSASHGCIRMSNPDITALARVLPLGTPITIE